MGPVGPVALPGRRPRRRRADARRPRRRGRHRRRARGGAGGALAGEDRPSSSRELDSRHRSRPGTPTSRSSATSSAGCADGVVAARRRLPSLRGGRRARAPDAPAVQQDATPARTGVTHTRRGTRAAATSSSPRTSAAALPPRASSAVRARGGRRLREPSSGPRRSPALVGRPVGMYGFSYPGATQCWPRRAQPPSLRAIAPGFTSSQFYDGGRTPAARCRSPR